MQPIRTRLGWPRMKPATRPMIPPKMRPKMMEATPTVSDTRPPQMTREKMSRPRLSVPNQCAELAEHLRQADDLVGVLERQHGREQAPGATTRPTQPDAIQNPSPRAS